MNKLSVFLFLLFQSVFYRSKATDNFEKQLEQKMVILEQAYSSGQHDSLAFLLQDVEKEAIKAGDYRKQIAVLRIKGAWQFLSGEHVKALQTLLLGIEIGLKNAPCHELVIIYYEAGTLQSKNNNIQQAHEMYQKGLAMANILKDTIALADGNNRIGLLFEKSKKLDSALYFFNKGYELNLLANDSIGLSYNLENIATILAQQNQFKQAIANLRKALSIRKSKKDQYGIAIATINLSECFLTSGQIDSAIFYALEAEKAGRSIHFLDLIQHTYMQLSDMYKSKKMFEKALQYHERYISLHDSIFNDNKSKQLAELNVQFDTERKEQKIRSLSKQKTIHLLGLTVLFLGLITMILVAITLYKNKKRKEEKLLAESAFKIQLKEAEARNELQNERLRISRELHDNIGAHLTFIKATADELNKEDALAQQVKNLTSETIKELRKTVWLINKSTITVEEFSLKLKDFYQAVPQVLIQQMYKDSNQELSAEKITELFRGTQEAVNNAIKHAGSDKILICINSDSRQLCIEINDNGKGFDTQNQTSNGFGLQNLQYRMESIGGTCNILSTIGKGTKISLCLGWT